MTRVTQPAGQRGSLKWIQRAVNLRPALLDDQILAARGGGGAVRWVSPRADDDYAEYRDRSFLERIGHAGLADRLADFWPSRGPQWDALATTDSGAVLLVEAKAHINELCSPGSSAAGDSRRQIEQALSVTASHMGARPLAPWIDAFYQLANRLAHLHFLRDKGVDARLVLVNFTGDADMNGPSTPAEWEAAYKVVYHVMGIPARNPLEKFVHHLYPPVAELQNLDAADPAQPAGLSSEFAPVMGVRAGSRRSRPEGGDRKGPTRSRPNDSGR